MTFQEMATDPHQYDRGEVDWAKEGDSQHFTRRMMLEALLPQLSNVEGKNALDIGSGLGWLCDELAKLGAHPTGIEPSAQNVEAAKQQYPELDFRHTSLEDFETTGVFEIISAVMVFEHFRNLRRSFDKIKELMSSKGRLIVLSGDYHRFTHSRPGAEVQVERIVKGESATRSDYGERAGVLYDVFRTPERFMLEASHSGLNTISREPVLIPEWLKIEVPQYKDFGNKPIFHVFVFERAK